jgi:hypothetical protein
MGKEESTYPPASEKNSEIKTPPKMQRLHFYSCNTSSFIKHPGVGQNFVKKWIK